MLTLSAGLLISDNSCSATGSTFGTHFLEHRSLLSTQHCSREIGARFKSCGADLGMLVMLCLQLLRLEVEEPQ